MPTVRTVAALAGVSIASASRVLNGLGGSSETVRRVRESAERVGYVPNAIARSLQAKRTGLLALAVADIGNPVYVEMMRAIEVVAKQAGYQLLVHATDADAVAEVALLDRLAQRYVDGLILSPLRVTDGHLAALRRSPVPVVVVGSLPADAPFDNVRADSHTGVGLAVRHLVQGGRRRIAFVNGAIDTTPGAARLVAFRDALKEAGLRVRDELVESGEFQYGHGRAATARLLALPVARRPDAIFCANDLIAVGALHALLAGGVRVPEDIALVGMDDTDLAQMSFPQISSVSLGAQQRGAIAADLLLTRLASPQLAPRRETVAPRLAVRTSSAATTAPGGPAQPPADAPAQLLPAEPPADAASDVAPDVAPDVASEVASGAASDDLAGAVRVGQDGR